MRPAFPDAAGAASGAVTIVTDPLLLQTRLDGLVEFAALTGGRVVILHISMKEHLLAADCSASDNWVRQLRWKAVESDVVAALPPVSVAAQLRQGEVIVAAVYWDAGNDDTARRPGTPLSALVGDLCACAAGRGFAIDVEIRPSVQGGVMSVNVVENAGGLEVATV